MTTGQKIRSRRRAMEGIIISRLATEIGCSPTHMLDIEQDRTSPRVSEIKTLAGFFGCHILNLLDDDLTAGMSWRPK